MLKMPLVMLTAVYFANTSACCIYEKNQRDLAICECEELLTGIYTKDDYADLERQTAPQDIYARYMAQNQDFPYEFLTLCEMKDKVPLIVIRPTDYTNRGIDELVCALAGYNKPAFVEIDSSYSEKAKKFFRNVAEKIHLQAPSAAMVWGINSKKVKDISNLYPGDSYVDWVALNISEKSTDGAIALDPEPVYATFSYFEKNKPIMLNISLACYSEEGHKYYASQAAEKLERLYWLGKENSAVKAINYFSTTPDNDLKCCERVLKAFKNVTAEREAHQKLRLPILAYNNDGSFFCEKGFVPIGEESCIINGKKYYKIKDTEKYNFVEIK